MAKKKEDIYTSQLTEAIISMDGMLRRSKSTPKNRIFPQALHGTHTKQAENVLDIGVKIRKNNRM